jgi:hypothetical protein
MKPRATVRRWTQLAHPNPWEFYVPAAHGTVRGTRATWQLAFNRVLQLIADQTCYTAPLATAEERHDRPTVPVFRDWNRP